MPAKQRTTDTLICAHCGQVFPYKQSGRKANRFCSWECLQASRTPDGRFWAKVNTNGQIPEACPGLGPCWLWTGSVFTATGYGQFWLDGTNRRAHVVSFEWSSGPTNGLQVQHLCNVRICIRPTHLVLGTPAENTQYAVSTGRMVSGDRHWQRHSPERRVTSPGERNGMAVLTEEDVLSIHRLRTAGMKPKEIAERFPVTIWMIYQILRGDAWSHLKPPHD